MADEQEVNENSQEEVQSEEQVVDEAVENVEEEVKEERPEKNYKAEIARKNAEIERLRALAASRPAETVKHDPTDLSTWHDHELKAVIHSNDPQALAIKDKAEEVLLDRRLAKTLEKRESEGKKVLANLKLSKEYPEANDPTSEFALKMEEVMQEYDLSKSPAGRLAAAKIVASELKKGSSTASAKERNAEQARVARVKGQMVDGDRSKSIENTNPKKQQQIREDLSSKNVDVQARAVGELLKGRGMDRDSFFKK